MATARSDEINIRVAILSDLHFISEAAVQSGRQSWLTLDAKTKEPKETLWSDLLQLVESENLTCDVVVCPGDITTFADKLGLQVAWEKLIDLGIRMKAKVVCVATGNHDVQSRSLKATDSMQDMENVTDLIENLKTLAPCYPVFMPIDEGKDLRLSRTKYFGDDYIHIDEFDNFRVIIFNSCARHTTEAKERNRGHIAPSCLDWMESELKAIPPESLKSKINIFLCHHHPMFHIQEGHGQYDFMSNGQTLLDMLSRTGDWLVIHGHKHEARISYSASIGSRAPTVFAAGTLSAHTDSVDGFRNQFYLLDLDYQKKPTRKLKGTLNVWNWNKGFSWVKAEGFRDGLFSGIGFGEKGIQEIAQNIKSFMEDEIFCDWSELQKQFPQIKYITPSDIRYLQSDLNDEHDIELLIKDGVIISVSLKVPS